MNNQHLPILQGNKVVGSVTAEVTGEMVDGRKVWQDKIGQQYLKVRINRKCYFIFI